MSNQSAISLDKPMFVLTLVVILCVTLPILIFNDSAGAVITNIFDLLTTNLGWVYQWYTLLALFFLVWLAFSRFGTIKLSSHDEPPQYNTLTWITMIFCAGVGAGLLYWAVIEWSYYLKTPPLGLDVGSTAAKEMATTYPLFH